MDGRLAALFFGAVVAGREPSVIDIFPVDASFEHEGGSRVIHASLVFT